ncbi:EAL domain-containing protein [Luteimonas sp. 50]|uniref:EAL domain-containing protein n=1 Tax=Cognatiluteimonas sedimenti TaxID=2927791 RepID=A0ABT0A778_9GAMM|nr:EAL domain-containing protein [Lysobacter sedimenti]MCJ0826841.1 EAL domain-containing protein [Lysobacter sedimenti]
MAYGVALAVVLPVLCLGLVGNEYAQAGRQARAHASLLTDALEKPLRDRLLLLAWELDALAAHPDPRSISRVSAREIIPLQGLRVDNRRPAGAASERLWLGPPRHGPAGWQVPVARSMDGGRWLHAEVDAAMFNDLVADYSLPAGDMIALLHEHGGVLARAPASALSAGSRLQGGGPPPGDRQAAAAGHHEASGSADGVERVVYYRRLPDFPLVIEAGISRASILRQWVPFAAATLALSLLLAGSWAWLVARFQRAQSRQDELIGKLDSSEHRLREAHGMAGMGEWGWNLRDNSIHWSEEVCRIYGRSQDDAPPDVQAVLELVHPDDVPRLRALADQVTAGARQAAAEFRVLLPGGAQRHVQARGELQVDASGDPWLRGVQQDITALTETRERLRAAEAQYRFLFKHNPLPMWVFDRESLRFLAVNDAMVRHYGYDRETLLSMTLLDIRPREDRAAVRHSVDAPIDERLQGEVWTHLRSDGKPLRMAIHSHDIEFEHRPARLVAADDVTERERSEQRFRLVARATSDAVWDWDVVTGDLWWSDSFFSVFGYGRGDMAPTIQAWESMIHPDDLGRVIASLELALQSHQEEWQEGYRFRRKDGSYAEVQDRGFILRDARGSALRAAGGMLDMTQALRDNEDLRLLRRAVDSAANGIVIADARRFDFPVVYVNRGFEEITGYRAQDVLGRNCRILRGDDREQPALEAIRNALRDGSEARVMLRNYRADGTQFCNEFHLAPVHDDQGTLTHFIGIISDATERQKYEQQLAHRATHDELTGLPNRQLLHDRLQQAILNADRYGRQAGVVFIDLDDFKLVNDNLGHSAGDAVLREVAQRLSAMVRETDTVGRFGGDEFVVVLTEQADDEGMSRVIDLASRVLSEPMHVAGITHTLTPSIGWCRYPEAGRDAETLLMRADVAMYQAKRSGRNRAVAYRAEFDAEVSQRLHLLAELREALRLQQFTLVFQPLFDRAGEAVALEALVRWQHPQRGLLSPAEFIGVCEESGLIVELGRWVLQEAARHHRLLDAAGLGRLRMAVNVSAAQFGHDLASDVKAALQQCPMPAGALELEITESLIMHNFERTIELMQQLAAMGVSFAVDDFGTGHSSLAYLKRLPIDRLKIDRSFVQDLATDPDDATICASVINLAHSLHLSTVAEGVETKAQLDWLRERGCDEVQGFLLGRPQAFASLLPVLLGHGGPRPAA